MQDLLASRNTRVKRIFVLCVPVLLHTSRKKEIASYRASVYQTGTMAVIAHMQAAFVKCGLNNATANYVITDQGFDSPYDLLMASKESVDTMVKNAIK